MTGDKAEFERKFRVIQEQFVAELGPRHRQIREHWARLQHQWQASELEALYLLVHRLAGAGETFGFAELSRCARSVDQLIQPCPRQHPPEAHRYRELEQAVAKLSQVLEALEGRQP